MTETRFDGPGAPGSGGDHDDASDRWSRRPRRSETDRKIAGVAGGLGRSLGIDPVLIRVAFAVLALFGGSGVLLYVLGWLLLPADRDQASAAEAMLGRGRSSVSPAVAVGLAIVALVSALSMFSWGLPFIPAPVIIVAVVVFFVVKGKRRGTTGFNHQTRQEWMDRVDLSVRDLSERASRLGASWGRPSGGTSPFDSPAFWERDGQGGWRAAPGSGPASAFTASTSTAPTFTASTFTAPPNPADRVEAPPPAPEPAEAPAPMTPPAWDPLGVAPFAWDLPEPSPLPTGPAAPAARRDSGVVTRVIMGLAVLAGGLAALGVVLGWWTMSWAQVAAIALTVVATGLIMGSLRGRGRGLIGHGIFLSLVTAALAVTGISGTSGYGQQEWTPTLVSDVQPNYLLNGGEGVLDLSDLVIPAKTETVTELVVRAGHAQVILPMDTNYDITCSANAGQVDCLGANNSGLHSATSKQEDGFTDRGTLRLEVKVGAGFAEVRK